MRADLRAGVAAIALCFPAVVAADPARSGPELTLTEAGAPTARPWEKAAIISATIDRAGEDYLEVHAHGDLQFDLLQPSELGRRTRVATLGPSLNWDRSTRAGKEQDDLKAGAVFYYYDEPDLGSLDPNRNPLFWSVQANANYAHTAVYPDKTKPPCSLPATSPLCDVQHKESVKGKVSVFPYLASFEDSWRSPGAVYSFRPQVQLAHDQIVDGTLDAVTLRKVTGGYTSVLVGAGLNVRPRFISPRFEVNGLAQLRQRLSVADSRRSTVEQSAERFELSATYYLMQDDLDPNTKNWRVGLSVTWVEGSDPFEEVPKASTITFGVRLGRF